MKPDTSKPLTGQPLDRVDGRLKVTGQATYGAEFAPNRLAHGVMVKSTIAAGRVTGIDTTTAEKAEGVLAVLTYKNAPRLKAISAYPQAWAGQGILTMQDDQIQYSGQDVALVIADTFERASYAASLINVTYQEQAPLTSFAGQKTNAYTTDEIKVEPRGNALTGLQKAAITVKGTYQTPIHHHNPMEPHATVAQWDGDRLKVYNPTQWVFGTQRGLAEVFGIPTEHVRVVSPFIGGGFGNKAPVWPHTIWACAAARQLNRPVKIVLSREDMYTSVGHRPTCEITFSLGATATGQLTAIAQESYNHTAAFGDHVQHVFVATPVLYACPNVSITHKLVKLNTGGPFAMRAPGETENIFALESAMDELAVALNMDPLALRLRNYADTDPRNGNPWSSKSLKACYTQAAQRFGWARRTAEARSMRDGNLLVGWGMATALYPTYLSPSAATAKVGADGRAEIRTGGHELGTGTYTIFTQIAADALGLPLERVTVKMGDSDYPKTPVAGGSRSTASIGPSVQAAAQAVQQSLIALAIKDKKSPLFGAKETDVVGIVGHLQLKENPSVRDAYTAILERAKLTSLEEFAEWIPDGAKPGDKSKILTGTEASVQPNHAKFSAYTFGAVFVEVSVDEAIGRVRVRRMVSAYGAGKIMNEKTAQNQIRGGNIFGIGMGLMEESILDPVQGRFVNANIADYHLPVQADVPAIDAFFVEETDKLVNPLGAKGVGEVGIVGVAAAIANAVYHATGKRIRELPITPEKIMGY